MYEGGQCHAPAWCYCWNAWLDRRMSYVLYLGRVLLQHSAACLSVVLLQDFPDSVAQLFFEGVTGSMRLAGGCFGPTGGAR